MSVSIIIPTHNREELLRKAVLSVFEQTMLPAELIVVDDGSIPPVADNIFSGCPSAIKTTLLSFSQPKGANAARNAGARASNSMWLAFLDDDDEFRPNKIELVSAQFEKNIDFIYHPAQFILYQQQISYLTKPLPFSENTAPFAQLLKENRIGATSMVVIKKELFNEAGGFDEGLAAMQDYELWLRISLLKPSFYLCQEPLTNYYSYSSLGSTSKSLEKLYSSHEYIALKYKSEISLLGERYDRLFQQLRYSIGISKAILKQDKYLAFRMSFLAFLKFGKLKFLFAMPLSLLGSRTIYIIKSRVKIRR